MRIAKYNTNKGSNTYKATINNYIGGGNTVDTSGLEAQIATNANNIATNRVDIVNLQNIVNAIPNTYLRRTGDSSIHYYRFGKVYTDNLESGNYSSGRGFSLSGDSNSAEEDKYIFKIIDLGNGYIPFTATTSDQEQVSYTSYAKKILEQDSAFTITNSIAGASVVVSAGYNVSNRYFTIISQKLQYQVYQSLSINASPSDSDAAWNDAEYTGGWEIPLASNGRECTYKLRYIVEYSYDCGNTTLPAVGFISLYIEGTDAENNQTFSYGGSSRYSEMTSSYVQCLSGSCGYKMMADGIYKTTDGGETWTKVL